MIENMNNAKLAMAAIVAALTALWGWFGWVVVLYVICMVIDYVTGSMAAARQGKWTSKDAREGIWHKTGSLIAVIVAGLSDIIIAIIINNIAAVSIGIEYTVLLCPIVLVWYILTELGSIAENADKMGAPVPKFLKAAIKFVNDNIEDVGDKIVPREKQ